MPAKTVTINRMHKAVHLGEDRLKNFRASRLLFLKQYAGQYYDRGRAIVGNEPLNLIFNAVSTLVPNLVTNFPKSTVTTDFLNYRGYAELLSLGLDYLAKKVDLRSELRRWIVDAIFTLGVMKTGIATSRDTVTFSDDDRVDMGTPYATVVDFDDFFLDAACRRIEESAFVGHRIRLPRAMLLESGLYQNDLVERLPSYASSPNSKYGSDQMSQSTLSKEQIGDFQDLVSVRELWVPSAQAVVTVPDGKLVLDRYLRIEDYDGPDEGMFTYLSFAPPMPNNPMPVAPVGIWYDLHVAANQMIVKVMEQAARQKDVLGYKMSAADDAQEIVDAGDGDAIGMMDIDAAKVFSYGGQKQSNEAHIAQLSHWFNLASGNTDQLGGVKSDANTATQASILEANSSVRVEDMRDLVYLGTQSIERKLAWYLHNDPLISLPLIKRKPIPGRTEMGPMGPVMTPPRMEEEQVLLTPDTREGEFLDFHFTIEKKSMSRMDPNTRLQKALIFAGKVLPAAAQAAMVCQQMQVPFSFPKFVTRMAKEMDIEWIDEVFYDPEFQSQVVDLLNKTPQSNKTGGGGGMGAVLQNGQPGNVALKDRDAAGGPGPEMASAAQPESQLSM